MTVFRATIVERAGFDFGSPYNFERFKEWAKEHVGAVVRIEHEVPVRSRTQNNFYWVYLGIISRETGDDPNSLHEFFRRKLLPPKFVTVRGQEIRIPTSTTELSKSDFSEYLMRIAYETEIPIPDPAEAGYISNY